MVPLDLCPCEKAGGMVKKQITSGWLQGGGLQLIGARERGERHRRQPIVQSSLGNTITGAGNEKIPQELVQRGRDTLLAIIQLLAGGTGTHPVGQKENANLLVDFGFELL